MNARLMVIVLLAACGVLTSHAQSRDVQYEAQIIGMSPSEENFVSSDTCSRCLYLKTNTLGIGLAISNLSAEIDLARHWSISVPVYYSAWNYFTPTIKFKTFAVQPEIRFWIRESNNGFFLGPHFGVGSYNIAIGGDVRYQDNGGTSPALGGGISTGYRMPISRSGRWHIELAVGAGVYALKYDSFYNLDNGKLIDTQVKTYWGVDNLAINIAYRFGLNKYKK